ncbi:GLPGLI family protein [Pedobacter terrae]|uniref:GLPGLI family protein n=1 Tax=Pedobacter terrae TaxID=405671 RepID=A0A1G8CL92_9SPHI|nr:GLPGLI family protein [Pedobacter terrae]SDH45690.1 GLPGLI family protein [Pedobacter terrae]
MRFFLMFLFLFLLSGTLQCQILDFVAHGQFEFERKINTYPIYEGLLLDNKNVKEEDKAKSFIDFKSKNAQFLSTTFKFSFNHNTWCYEFYEGDNKNFLSGAAFDNIIYGNIDTDNYISQMNVFGNKFIVSDSLRKIKWRLTDELREIAGFQCRRANASLNDSVYVVAYYTDQIPLKSGPEMFNGLPGMILGVFLPNEHISWFATKFNGNVLDVKQYNEVNAKIQRKTYEDTYKKFLNQYGLTSKWFKSFLNY